VHVRWTTQSEALIRVALVVLLVVPPKARAQHEGLEVVYTLPQLNCARFLESAESDVRTETGGRIRLQTSGRTGVWEFRAQPGKNGALAIEGWLDSLTIWRRSDGTDTRPDTDGLIGGRYRGDLSPRGSYLPRVRPFIPDEVAEIAGMATALDDFFPPLAGRQLRPGESWTDSDGVSLRRLPDSALSASRSIVSPWKAGGRCTGRMLGTASRSGSGN
jgi:hypothetical protein